MSERKWGKAHVRGGRQILCRTFGRSPPKGGTMGAGEAADPFEFVSVEGEHEDQAGDREGDERAGLLRESLM